ncbi:MAG: hypothetical protein IKU37_03215 [Candidatus Gastranaerophilales bacterium]|nr:hypothetical protein [Candidatus Gastranaerophilales bacterium]
MGLSASQGRLLLLTAKRSDLEFRAQQISQKRLLLSQQLEEISLEYEAATSNRQMSIMLYQTQANNSSEQSYRSSNLTYASLVSGTVGMGGPGADIAGIQASGNAGTEYYAFSSNTAYRLVSTSGALVVSDASEIPGYNEDGVGEYNYTHTVYKAAEQLKNGDNPLFGGNAYVTNNQDNSKSYSFVANGVLAELLGENNTTAAIQFDRNNGLIKYNDKNGDVKYCKLGADGNFEEVTLEEDSDTTYSWDNATLYKDKASIPQSAIKQTDKLTTEVVEGADGLITIFRLDENGEHIDGGTRYIVDESLRYGSTDGNGSTDGPNYLQDCLRNGKYLIQKGSVDQNNDLGYRWSNVSWDATVNISDSYYTADDDAAKAKYDRLQNQIQAQDKKLELELDNIETQRSAVTTEIESVENVIKENIESTFNTFG